MAAMQRRVLGAMLLILCAAPAVAQGDRNERWCAGEGAPTAEQKIAGCTAVIAAGGDTRRVASAYNARGGQFYYKGEHLRAIADYDEAIRLYPEYAQALNNRCWANAVVGRLDAGLADCDAAAHLSPGNGNTYENRAFIHLRIGNYDRALADYDVAFKLEPESGDVLYGRGIAKLKKGDSAGGNADVAAGKKIKPWVGEEFERYGIKAP
jgi:tetratricopeptide (TPR) repeat protein